MTFDSWKSNVVAASLGFVVVFLLSVTVNLLSTALKRAAIAAVLLFTVTYCLRYMYRKIEENKDIHTSDQAGDDNSDALSRQQEWSDE